MNKRSHGAGSISKRAAKVLSVFATMSATSGMRPPSAAPKKKRRLSFDVPSVTLTEARTSHLPSSRCSSGLISGSR